MNLSGFRDIGLGRDAVWSGLLDGDVLQRSVPGCTELTGSATDGFEAVVVQKVGPVKATFRGAVVLEEMVAPESLVLRGEGKGGAAGFAKGGAHVRLEETTDGTRLHYEVEAKVGGKLAQLGSRIIDGFAKKMADQFFENFQSVLEGSPEEEEATTEAEETDETAEKKGWLKRLVKS
ncbi:CoxG family protein [Parasulfitobacter algicola]|uniref:Carbon monoxide dehydrogenase subunit G n=1 Tax=Parasulfitobacter algicola TaxID=2614809 RepID=A0ABX2IUK8_9RHOB|nr:carbon monoxide dehydrogenase subunit G [Sulfitobacter algicola]NSX56235.1 carbon monoxide dehydrogenase subunit G [Sulfitobacter algicola]